MRPKPIVIVFASAGVLFAQAGSETRGILPEEVWKARPAAKSAAPAAPRYQAVGPSATHTLRQATAGARQVGVTIWKLRTAAAGESGARILVQQDTNSVEFIPERVASRSALKAGDRVRLSVESPDAGYLYVIDRERYSSGERGDPYLIFPTTRTRDGDNHISGGKLIDIPAQDDRPSFFTLQQSRPDQTEEELTILLMAQPIDGLAIGPKALKLSNDQVAKWEKQWGAVQVERFELTGGEGKRWTAAEQQAGANGTRLLTQEDPPPQTIYRAAIKPGDPVMLKVRLRYAE